MTRAQALELTRQAGITITQAMAAIAQHLGFLGGRLPPAAHAKHASTAFLDQAQVVGQTIVTVMIVEAHAMKLTARRAVPKLAGAVDEVVMEPSGLIIEVGHKRDLITAVTGRFA